MEKSFSDIRSRDQRSSKQKIQRKTGLGILGQTNKSVQWVLAHEHSTLVPIFKIMYLLSFAGTNFIKQIYFRVVSLCYTGGHSLIGCSKSCDFY